MEEQIDDIQVEINRSHDVLLGGQFVHQHARVKDDEQWKKQSSSGGNQSIHQNRGKENLQNKS